MYIYFSHQNDVSCFHVQVFFSLFVTFVPPAPGECLFFFIFNIMTHSMFVHKAKRDRV